jgi:hypothetical protein
MGHVTCEREMRTVYNSLVGESEGKRPLERLRRRWEDNIKMDVKVIVCENVDCIHLAQDDFRVGLL